jgi:hypothetical protein
MQLPGINTEKLIECLQESNNAIARMAENIRPAIAKVPKINVPEIPPESLRVFSDLSCSCQEFSTAVNRIFKEREEKEHLCKFDARSPYLKCAVNPT